MEVKAICEKVRTYVIENFYFGKGDAVKNEANLMEEGAIDSTGFMELVSFVEESFPIEVDDEDLSPDNFSSIERVGNYIVRKCGGE